MCHGRPDDVITAAALTLLAASKFTNRKIQQLIIEKCCYTIFAAISLKVRLMMALLLQL